MLVSRIDNILDTEISWRMFMADTVDVHSEVRDRYQRINPKIGLKIPALDQVSKLSELQDTVCQTLSKDRTTVSKVKEIAHRLVASTFYFEMAFFPVNSGNYDSYHSGMQL